MKRIRPNGRSNSREPLPRKIKVCDYSPTNDEGYPIVRFSNIKIHKPTAEYLTAQVPLTNKHQI